MNLYKLVRNIAMFAFWLVCALFLILLMTHLVSCDPSYMDRCWTVEDGVELRPGPVPRSIGADGPSLSDENLSDIVPGAVEWWNEQVGREMLWHDLVTPDITVEANYLEPTDMVGWYIIEDYDLTEVHFSTYDGAMSTCHIILNIDFAYHRPTMEQALYHSIGHCFGLRDDPGIDQTVELRSIMSSPLDPLGELTMTDRECLLAAMEE